MNSSRRTSGLAVVLVIVVILVAYLVAYHFVGNHGTVRLAGSDDIDYVIYDHKWEAVFFLPALKAENLIRQRPVHSSWMHNKSEHAEPFE